jgi:TPR repeat protein
MILALTLVDPSLAAADAYEDGLAAYEQGQYQRALDLWLPLALAGHCRAQFGLGRLADRHSLQKPGVSIELDAVTAAKLIHSFDAEEYWYTEAAEQGHVEAMRELAEFYRSGLHHVVVPDFVVKMDYWYRRAAESGDLSSMRDLMDRYYDSDPFESLKWALVLKELGAPTKVVDPVIADLSRRLSEDDISNARREARWWEPDRHPPTLGSPCE